MSRDRCTNPCAHRKRAGWQLLCIQKAWCFVLMKSKHEKNTYWTCECYNLPHQVRFWRTCFWPGIICVPSCAGTRAQVRLREAAPLQPGTGFQSIFISGSGNKLSMGISLGFKYAFEEYCIVVHHCDRWLSEWQPRARHGASANQERG